MTDLAKQLNNELHARPDMQLSSPARICQFLKLTGEVDADRERQIFASMCEKAGQSIPAESGRFHIAQAGPATIKWEQHTEATSYTVAVPGNSTPLFSQSAESFLPGEFSQHLQQGLLASVQIEVVPESSLAGEDGYHLAAGLFGSETIVGGWMSDRFASVWTSFHQDRQGFIRFLIIDHGISDSRLGRLIHRLVNIESYRMLALLGLPVARDVMRAANDLESDLDDVISRLAANPGTDEQEELLVSLTDIAAQAEHIAATSAYRFAASKAYGRIVKERFVEVREEIQHNAERITVFLSKRLGPAMRTCEAAELRIQTISDRISRTVRLLNTRVDIVNRKQTQEMLVSMERQARMQVQLQMAVEGFSIVAISYYGTGLLGYLLKSAQKLGVPVDVTLIQGLSLPLVAVIAWTGLRLAKRKLKKVVPKQ